MVKTPIGNRACVNCNVEQYQKNTLKKKEVYTYSSSSSSNNSSILNNFK